MAQFFNNYFLPLSQKNLAQRLDKKFAKIVSVSQEQNKLN